MTQLPELLPGYESRFIETNAGKIFARIGGTGSPVLLLHGYPESNVMWHRLAPLLAQHHTLIIPDLPGYGQSDAPESGAGHSPYDKRSMAKAMVQIMQSLGNEKFAVVGHDRGGRVAYRMALDHLERVTKISTLDIVPTWEMWTGLNAKRAMKVFHWTFLAQPYPLPEMLIGKMPVEYLEWKMLAWNGKGENSVFDPRALDHYRAAFKQPERLHATCEDYRAGQTTDFAHDDADQKAGRKIAAPLLALWGASGIPAAGESPLDVWKRWAVDVSGKAIPCGISCPRKRRRKRRRSSFRFWPTEMIPVVPDAAKPRSGTAVGKLRAVPGLGSLTRSSPGKKMVISRRQKIPQSIQSRRISFFPLLRAALESFHPAHRGALSRGVVRVERGAAPVPCFARMDREPRGSARRSKKPPARSWLRKGRPAEADGPE